MPIRDLKKAEPFVAGDATIFRSLFHPVYDKLDLPYCIGEARLKKGKTSLWHRLKSTEMYFILEGTGRIEIGREKAKVKAGMAILIPADAKQRIKNTGRKDLAFLCIVSPAWKQEDEEALE
ncbi:MAG: cupin domain-containing protein [Candidatus ainarchaeum sp.]|nr:cupin domain-containing protein [Candidatus ainarchaeum sp.]